MHKMLEIITHKSLFAYVIFISLLIYLSIGIFPFTYYESDALGIVSGCKRILETGIFGENYYTYQYQTQAGIYFWVIFFSKLLNVELMVSYSIISAVFGILFLLLSASFVSKIINIPYPISGLILLLFQEIYISWYYMNSATGAAFFMIAGLMAIYNKSTINRILLSSMFLALSAWTRLDVAIVFPVILFLVKADHIKQRLVITSLIVFFFTVFLFILFEVSNANHYSSVGRGGSMSLSENIKTANGVLSSQMMRAVLGFFSVLVVALIFFGSILLIKKKWWVLLCISFFPLFLFMLLINGSLASGKHLLYYTPFLSIPIAFFFKHISTYWQHQKLSVTILCLLFLGQYIIGFQFFFKSYPYISHDYSSVKPYPSYLKLPTLKPDAGSFDSIRVVIGGGMKLATSDEMMLSSGIFFAPIMWNKLKSESAYIYTSFSKYINEEKEDTLYITTSQGGVYPVKNILYLTGFKLNNPESSIYKWGFDTNYIWQRENKYVMVSQSTYSKKNYEEYIEKFEKIKYNKFIHVAFWDWERWYMNKYAKHSATINNAGYIFQK